MPQEKPKKKIKDPRRKNKKTHQGKGPPGLASKEKNPYTGRSHRGDKVAAKKHMKKAKGKVVRRKDK